jgi:AhpD family alkylhydroperoxidase
MSHKRDEFAAGLGRLAKEPGTKNTFRAFNGLHEAALADGSLSRKTKEIMAVSIAIATSCEGCIAWHIGGAVKEGATREELAEAINVAILMGGGPATYYGSHALDYLDEEFPS